jgi:hypothetical protein
MEAIWNLSNRFHVMELKCYSHFAVFFVWIDSCGQGSSQSRPPDRQGSCLWHGSEDTRQVAVEKILSYFRPTDWKVSCLWHGSEDTRLVAVWAVRIEKVWICLLWQVSEDSRHVVVDKVWVKSRPPDRQGSCLWHGSEDTRQLKL